MYAVYFQIVQPKVCGVCAHICIHMYVKRESKSSKVLMTTESR